MTAPWLQAEYYQLLAESGDLLLDEEGVSCSKDKKEEYAQKAGELYAKTDKLRRENLALGHADTLKGWRKICKLEKEHESFWNLLSGENKEKLSAIAKNEPEDVGIAETYYQTSNSLTNILNDTAELSAYYYRRDYDQKAQLNKIFRYLNIDIKDSSNNKGCTIVWPADAGKLADEESKGNEADSEKEETRKGKEEQVKLQIEVNY